MSAEELLFVAFLALGAWVQAVSGFAMALLGIALAAACTDLPLPLVTATTTLAALVNIVGSLHGRLRHVDWPLWRQMSLLQVPGVWLGLGALAWLDGAAATALHVLLGAFVLATGIAMMMRPQPSAQRSTAAAAVAAGGLGGLFSGLFGAGGPATAWFVYRQPLAAESIRATLLAWFLVGGVVRTLGVAASGGLDAAVLRLAAAALPAALLGTWLGRTYRPARDLAARRFAFTLLMLSGALILLDAGTRAAAAARALPG
jgi:uncharacterized membrane protein YfcA